MFYFDIPFISIFRIYKEEYLVDWESSGTLDFNLSSGEMTSATQFNFAVDSLAIRMQIIIRSVVNTDPRKLVFWRMLSLCVALPLVAIMSAVTYARQREKAKQPREPFLNLPYMCRRTKVLIGPICQNYQEKQDLRNLSTGSYDLIWM